MQNKQFSLTQGGNLTALVGLLVLVLQYYHVNIAAAELQSFLGAAVILVGTLTSWYGRYRKHDLTLLGFRLTK